MLSSAPAWSLQISAPCRAETPQSLSDESCQLSGSARLNPNSHPTHSNSAAVVDVLKSGDVVFIEVGSGLHLDEEGRNFSGVR